MSLQTDLPPLTLLLQEIQSLTSSMRRNQRWAHGSSSNFSTSQAPLPPYLHAGKRRRSPRKGRGSIEGVEEGDLMGGFVDLRRQLGEVKDITTLPPLTIVQPFLALIRSPLTSGPITSLALTSLHATILNILPLFLTPPPKYVAPSTPLQISLAHITSALSSCRFPSSSPQQDELVLIRLLRVIEALATPLVMPTSTSLGRLLDQMGDESVCELLEVGLGMLARARLSEGLRNTAQSTVQVIVRAVFARLKSLTPEDVENLYKAAKEAEEEREKREKLKEAKMKNKSSKERQSEDHNGRMSMEKMTSRLSTESRHTIESTTQEEEEEDTTPPSFTPYGLPTILELLRVLIALLNPTDQAHTDSMRLAALSVLNSALEAGGSSLGKWPELREGVRDEGCRYLFQLTRSDASVLLAQSLRTTSTLFSTMLPHLKLQMELFLSYLIDRLTPQTSPLPPHIQQAMINSPRPSTPSIHASSEDGEKTQPTSDTLTPTSSTPRPISLLPPVPSETRELMLETLTQISLRPSFMVDCWINFDCSVDSEDLFERLIAFLTRGVYPLGPPKQDGSSMLLEGLDNAQLLSLEILLGYVSAMSDRLDEGSEQWPETAPRSQDLIDRKAQKGLLLQGATLFNNKPKTGLAFLEEQGMINTEGCSGNTEEDKKNQAIAKFLRSSSRLDKKLVGEYISRPDQLGLLNAFIGLFDFKGKSIADAMRELLETFRLPGEAQPISRITEVFAEHFFSFNPPEIANQDAVYVLAYSVIMLNTDLHNPVNRKRMTIDDYKRNLRGVNDGKDFDPEYLSNIHDSIRKKEIILPEEHVGQPGFDYAWKSLMARTRTAGPMISCNTSIFDEAMFKLSWRPLISSIAYAFTMSAQDEHVIQKAITGFRQCASLAGHFNLPEVFDTIVQSLSSATGLLDDMDESGNGGYLMSNHPVLEKDNQTVTVSPLSIRFGQSYRSQLATVVLFTIAQGNGKAIREGWIYIFEMFQTLFLHSLLPTAMLQMEDFLATSGTTTIPMKSQQPQLERRSDAAGGGGGGLLSALSSYLLSPYGSSTDNVVVETSEEDVENALVAVDCLNSCKLEELYAEILLSRTLESEALIPAIRAIRQLAENRTTAKLERRYSLVQNGDTGSPRTVAFEGQLPYDPACVFHLEMMVSLAGRGRAHIADTWPIIFEYISILLNSAQSFSVLLVERAVVGLLKLCLIISETPALRDQLYLALDVLRSLPSSVLNSVSEQLMAGIAKILERDSSVIKSQTEWGLIIALFRATVNHPEASKVTLSIVQKMVIESRPPVTVDNWSGVVALLDEFATAAGAAAAGRMQGRRAQQQSALGPADERGMAALDSLYELRNTIPKLSEESGAGKQEAWNTFQLPPLLIISKHCVNGCREIRQKAIYYLQRLLLSPVILEGDQANLPIIFDRILFPVMDELLKPQVYERDPNGMAETRLRAATLLCKIFLQYVVRLAEGEIVAGLFVKVLDKLERYMKGEREMLNEAGESLKNVILVMHSSNILLPPPASDGEDTRTEGQKKLWQASSERIERILPGFLDDIVNPQQGAPVKQISQSPKSPRTPRM